MSASGAVQEYLQKLSAAISDIADGDNRERGEWSAETKQLVDCLEELFSCGVRPSMTERLFGTASGSFWPLLRETCSPESLLPITTNAAITSDKGRQRAWVITMANRGMLRLWLIQLKDRKALIKKHYSKARGALLINEDLYEPLDVQLQRLDPIKFSLPFLDAARPMPEESVVSSKPGSPLPEKGTEGEEGLMAAPLVEEQSNRQDRHEAVNQDATGVLKEEDYQKGQEELGEIMSSPQRKRIQVIPVATENVIQQSVFVDVEEEELDGDDGLMGVDLNPLSILAKFGRMLLTFFIPQVEPPQRQPSKIYGDGFAFEFNKPAETSLAEQENQCQACKKAVSGTDEKKPRQCSVTGSYYCAACFGDYKIPLPSLIVHGWNFDVQPVQAALAQEYLDHFETTVINLKAVQDQLVYKVPKLGRLQRVLKNLGSAWEGPGSAGKCPESVYAELAEQTRLQPHLFERKGYYTIQNLIDLDNDLILDNLERLLERIRKHVKEGSCVECASWGRRCALCEEEKSILFRFDDGVVECPQCLAIFHDQCASIVDRCPLCRRVYMSVQSPSIDPVSETS